jgi:mono/diheme cytochrome c family protein
MKRSVFLVSLAFLVLGGIPKFALAQQADTTAPLNDQQVFGRRVFKQRCAVCHLPPVPGAKVYGPTLFKELIAGNEVSIRDIIMNGSKGKMPGFKYGLEKPEVDAIIEYLKTVEKPRPTKTDNSGGVIVND